jgi:hypothetical protein
MRPLPLAILTGALLVAIFATMVVRFRTTLRGEIRQTIINRDATVLLQVAQRQLAQRSDRPPGSRAGKRAAGGHARRRHL